MAAQRWLRLAHRTSVILISSNCILDPEELARDRAFFKDAERVQVAPNTLTCRIERGAPVLISFFGDLNLGLVAAREPVAGIDLYVASILDIAGTKAAVVQKRAESKDYIDIDTLLGQGIDLPTMLAAGAVVYGKQFNPVVTLKALSYLIILPELQTKWKPGSGAVCGSRCHNATAIDPLRKTP